MDANAKARYNFGFHTRKDAEDVAQTNSREHKTHTRAASSSVVQSAGRSVRIGPSVLVQVHANNVAPLCRSDQLMGRTGLIDGR